MSDKQESYRSGSSARHGYEAQWRLKPDSAAMADLLDWQDVEPKWKKANYTLKSLPRLTGITDLIAPTIHSFEEDIAKHGLVSQAVAEAIVACMKTRIKERLLKHIEWRVVCVCVEESYSLTLADKKPERESEIDAVFKEHMDP